MRLLNIKQRPHNKYFGYTDWEDLYKRNYILKPEEWPWRDKEVLYTHNKQGYRAPEWKDVDWSNSILFFGCSFVYGVGINAEDSCAHQLSLLTNNPVVNLGCPGSSPMFQWVNTTILRTHDINPKAVVYYWPYAPRIAQLQYDKDAICHPTYPVRGGFNESWARTDEHNIEYLRYVMINTNLLWNCPILHYHMEESVTKLIKGLTHMPHSHVRTFLDEARDYNEERNVWHAGPETNKFWAKVVYDDLMKTRYADVAQG